MEFDTGFDTCLAQLADDVRPARLTAHWTVAELVLTIGPLSARLLPHVRAVLAGQVGVVTLHSVAQENLPAQ